MKSMDEIEDREVYVSRCEVGEIRNHSGLFVGNNVPRKGTARPMR